MDTATGNRSCYDLRIDGTFILIEGVDEELDPPRASVTNDAPNVIEDLVERGIAVDNFVVLFREPKSRWDAILTRNGHFDRFFSLGASSESGARETAFMRLAPPVRTSRR